MMPTNNAEVSLLVLLCLGIGVIFGYVAHSTIPWIRAAWWQREGDIRAVARFLKAWDTWQAAQTRAQNRQTLKKRKIKARECREWIDAIDASANPNSNSKKEENENDDT